MEEIVFKCEVVTPMFLAGADGKTPELRPPSIKGALRFWWRALNGHLSLEKLREKETKIFGGSGDRNAQKSNVIIRVIENELQKSDDDDNVSLEYIYKYLLYGIKEKKGYFKPEGTFGLKIIFRDKAFIEETITTLKTINKYGGLGSKSRNGFGSFKINGLDEEKHDFKGYGALKDYTAFSQYSRLYLSQKNHTCWKDALTEIGIAYKEAHNVIKKLHFRENKALELPKKERYTKPCFLHVDKCNEGFKGKILFLPSIYESGLDKNNQEQEKAELKYLTVIKELNAILEKQGLIEVNHG